MKTTPILRPVGDVALQRARALKGPEAGGHLGRLLEQGGRRVKGLRCGGARTRFSCGCSALFT